MLVSTGCGVDNKSLAELTIPTALESSGALLVSTGCGVDNKALAELIKATALESCGALLVGTGCSVVDNNVFAELVGAEVLELTTVGHKKYASFDYKMWLKGSNCLLTLINGSNMKSCRAAVGKIN